MKNYFIFLATLLLVSVISCTEMKNQEIAPINFISEDPLHEYINLYIDGMNRNIRYLNKLDKTQPNYTKANILSHIKNISNKTRLDEVDIKFMTEVLGFSTMEELEIYSNKIKLLQEQVLDKYPHLKQMNEQELNSFFEKQLEKYVLDISFLSIVQNRSTLENELRLEIEDGREDWNFSCRHLVMKRTPVGTPVEDLECPNGADYSMCQDDFEICVRSAIQNIKNGITSCISVGFGFFGATTVASSVGGFTVTVGFLVGLINGSAISIFCIDDQFVHFRDVLCENCNSEFSDCCIN